MLDDYALMPTFAALRTRIYHPNLSNLSRNHRPLIKIAFEAELLPKKYFDNSSQSIIDTALTKKFNILPLIFA